MSENVKNNGNFDFIKAMIFMVTGAFILLAIIVWGFQIRRFTDRAASAKGVVTKLNAGGSHPEIRFVSADGNEIEYSQGGLIFGYRTGDEVTVLYDAQDPKNASLDAFGALWGFPALGLILGGAFLVAGFFQYFVRSG